MRCGREQPLVLEEADLRDRDVRELVAQAPARPRRCGSGARAWGAGCRAHRSMKVSRYLPICSSSPFASCDLVDPAAVDERAVERALVLDGERRRRARRAPRGCARRSRRRGRSRTRASGRCACARRRARKLSPALPPPKRTTSAGPSRPSTSSCCAARDLLGRERLRRLDRRRRPSRAARRSGSSSSRPPGSGTRTRCSRRDSSGRSPAGRRRGRLRPPASPCRRGCPRASRRRPASSTLRPPDCWSRATSSARRMSILPCRMRRS